MKKILALLCAIALAGSLTVPALAAPAARYSTTTTTAATTSTKAFKDALTTDRTTLQKNHQANLTQRKTNAKTRADYLAALKALEKAGKTLTKENKVTQKADIAKIVKLNHEIATLEYKINVKLAQIQPVVKAGKNVTKLNTLYDETFKLQESRNADLKQIGDLYAILLKLVQNN